MKAFRKITFWLHLIAGVSAGIFIFIMCVTGALLSFEPNILEFAERNQRVIEVPSENAPRLSINEIVGKAIEYKPSAKPSNITLRNDKDAAAVVALGREGQIFINPYNGAVTGEGATGWRAFFHAVEDAHRWLALSGDGRSVGKSLNGAANFLFLFLAISGVYIWFPRRWSARHLKAALTPRWKVAGKARDFNWHTVIGFWSSLVLIVLTLTGVVISYQWAGNLVYTLTGNAVPQQPAPPNAPNAPNAPTEQQPLILPENLDELWTKAEAHAAHESIGLRLPLAKETAVFTVEEGIYWNRFARSTLTVNTKSGEVAKWEPYGEQNSGRRLRSWMRFTHTGESFGFVGQLVGFLACVGGAILVWTGFALALRRLANWRAKSAKEL